MACSNVFQIKDGRSGVEIPLANKSISVVAFGKAVIGMVTAVQEVLGDVIKTGVAVVPHGIKNDLIKHNKQLVFIMSS